MSPIVPLGNQEMAWNKIRKEINKTWIPLKRTLQVKWQYAFSKPNPTTNHLYKLKQLVIVTLTSYPKRYRSLHLTLKSLLMQSFKADRIILWIAHEDEAQLPQSVRKLIEQGLIQLKLTADTRSYKNIIPSLKHFPEDILITVDDDVYYHPMAIEQLIRTHIQFKDAVIANRTHVVKEVDQGFAPYRQWTKNGMDMQQPQYNFQTGIGGVLYPPGTFSAQVTDQRLFTQLAPNGDDIWLYWMMRLNGRCAIKTDNNFDFPQWLFSQTTALYKKNVREHGNDAQIQAMYQHFGSPLNTPCKPFTASESESKNTVG